ncbi:unnamed protein product [Arctia plantaginis]|uniref:Secreted protein n=1 Tax=Arctia plantaginis TaxID=874455 RepID=A0A8S0YQW5_ARCPL|nr:unnamed protein product [Arctia plantaginis]
MRLLQDYPVCLLLAIAFCNIEVNDAASTTMVCINGNCRYSSQGAGPLDASSSPDAPSPPGAPTAYQAEDFCDLSASSFEEPWEKIFDLF